MRVAVCSDLHGNIDAVKNIWEALHDADRIICLGDIVGIGPHPREVLEHVLDDKRVIRVMGNHDMNTRDGTQLGPIQHVPRRPHHDWVRSELGELTKDLSSPMSIKMELGGRKMVFMHRHPDDCGSKVPYFDRPFPEVLDDFYSDIDGDMIFFGHTHIPLMVMGNTGRSYLNPGSVGAENGGFSSFIVLDDENDKRIGVAKRTIGYDKEKVVLDLKRLKVPYHRFIIENFYNDRGWVSSTVKDI